MNSLYLETSAVLSWLLGEPGVERMVRLVNRTKTLVTSVLTLIETRRSLVRLESSGQLKAGERQKAVGLLESAAAGWELIEIIPEVQARAGQPFPVEPVRSLDAIHLASILELVRIFPDLRVMSLDRRILSNLEPLGLQALG